MRVSAVLVFFFSVSFDYFLYLVQTFKRNVSMCLLKLVCEFCLYSHDTVLLVCLLSGFNSATEMTGHWNLNNSDSRIKIVRKFHQY